MIIIVFEKIVPEVAYVYPLDRPRQKLRVSCVHTMVAFPGSSDILSLMAPKPKKAMPTCEVHVNGKPKMVTRGAPITVKVDGKNQTLKWNAAETVKDLQEKIDAAEQGRAVRSTPAPAHAPQPR